MSCFDYEDLRKRLTFAGYPENSEIHESVIKLAVVLDNEETSEIQKEIVLNLFSKTALDQLNSIPDEVLSKTYWREFDYGNVKKQDYVRVRLDAYDSVTGLKHNGRLGILVDMAARRCKVKYIGMPTVETMTHPMDNLESLRKV